MVAVPGARVSQLKYVTVRVFFDAIVALDGECRKFKIQACQTHPAKVEQRCFCDLPKLLTHSQHLESDLEARVESRI